MYKTYINKISIRPHSNDKYTKIKIGSVAGSQVIVGDGVEHGDIVVFFPSDGQLSKDFAVYNKLFRKHPDTGEELGGYLEENARIRQIKLGGEISEGIVVPLGNVFKYLCDCGYDELINELNSLIGQSWDGKIGDIEIVKKYLTPQTLKALKNKNTVFRREIPSFHKHFDTDNYSREKHKIIDGIAYITEKLHGTSHRGAYTFVEEQIELTWWEKLLNRLPKVNIKPKVFKGYEHVVGTRNVILEKGKDGSYGSNQYHYDIFCKYKDFLLPGETVYGEVVGWANQKPIMNPHDTRNLNNKAISKKYGNKMYYSYGCEDGKCKFFVYRITRVDPNGHVTELSWEQVKKRAFEMGLDTVPQLCYPMVIDTHDTDIIYMDTEGNEERRFRGVYNGLRSLDDAVNRLVDGSSTLDYKHIREGVCVRNEGSNGVVVLKQKSFDFGILEGYLRDEGELDLEESS